MLKLEKLSRHDLAIIFRSKERLFTPALITGLAFAIAFHLLFIFLFTVVAFPIPWNQTLLPPTQVEAQPLANLTSTTAHWNVSAAEISPVPLGKSSQPTLANTPYFLPMRPVELTQELSIHHPFLELEKHSYQPSFPFSTKKLPPLQLVISGLINQHDLIDDGLSEKFKSTASRLVTTDMRILFDVLVDRKSGKILWYNIVESTPLKTLNQLSEEVLRQMRFTTTHMVTSLAGSVEIHFHRDEESY